MEGSPPEKVGQLCTRKTWILLCILEVDESFACLCHAGIVSTLEGNEVVLASGERLPADILIWATGHRKTYEWLPADALRALGVEADGLSLYRNILPVGDVPVCALIVFILTICSAYECVASCLL